MTATMMNFWKRQRRMPFEMLLILRMLTFLCIFLAATVLGGSENVVQNGECESNNNEQGDGPGQCLATVNSNNSGDEAKGNKADFSNADVPWYRDLSECKDSNGECGFWAEGNECSINPGGMLQLCPKACKVCDNISGDYISNCYGEDQLVSGGAEERKQNALRIQEVEDYMLQKVFVEEKYDNIRAECKNRNKECSFWAVTGGKKIICGRNGSGCSH
jgi:hypothetical protein